MKKRALSREVPMDDIERVEVENRVDGCAFEEILYDLKSGTGLPRSAAARILAARGSRCASK